MELAADSGQRGLPHSHMRLAPMEMMENRLLGLRAALRIRGIATRALAAYADMCPALGYGVVRLGKKDADGAVGGCADTGPMQGSGGV